MACACFAIIIFSRTMSHYKRTWQAMSPDLRRKVDANRAARLLQEQTIKRQIDAQVSIFSRSV